MATSKELLTNLADELRTLTNTTDKMGLSKMTEHVSDANTEVDEQSAMVDELIAAMQGKSVSGEPETCTLVIDNADRTVYGVYALAFENGTYITKEAYRSLGAFSTDYQMYDNGVGYVVSDDESLSLTVNNVVCGSILTICHKVTDFAGYEMTNIEGPISVISSTFIKTIYHFTVTAPADGSAYVKIYSTD